MKKRNPIAFAVKKIKQKIVKNRKKYTRKEKHKKQCSHNTITTKDWIIWKCEICGKEIKDDLYEFRF